MYKSKLNSYLIILALLAIFGIVGSFEEAPLQEANKQKMLNISEEWKNTQKERHPKV